MDEISQMPQIKEKKVGSGIMKIVMLSIIFLLLAGGIVYFGITIENMKSNESILINQSAMAGYNQGATDVITYIAVETSQCKTVPLNVSGQIITLISVNCLQPVQA